MELLEDRMAPAVLTVNSLADNTSDTSVLTLRDAVTLVNNAGDPTSLGQAAMPAGWAAQIDTSGSGFRSNDTIQFDPSLFGSAQQTLTLGGSELLLASNVTITGPGQGQLAISGNNQSRIFEVNGGVTAWLSGVTIENGNTTDGPDYGGYAGAIANLGTLTVSNCTLSGNSAQYEGGAIGSTGTLTITNCNFTGNSAGDYGGAVNNYATMSVSDSTFSGNSAVTISGGAIRNMGTLTIDHSVISGNSASLTNNYWAGGAELSTTTRASRSETVSCPTTGRRTAGVVAFSTGETWSSAAARFPTTGLRAMVAASPTTRGP